MSSFIKIVATQIVNCAYLQSCIQMLGMHLLFVYVSVCDDQPTCLSPICFAWKSGPFFSSYGHNSVWIRDCLLADVSYFLCCTRKRKVVPFPRATKEIRDVCTREKFGGTPMFGQYGVVWGRATKLGNPLLFIPNLSSSSLLLSLLLLLLLLLLLISLLFVFLPLFEVAILLSWER